MKQPIRSNTLGNSIKALLTKGLLLVVVILTATTYAGWAFQNHIRAQWIVYGLEMRPYVYRAFVPILARILVAVGMGPELALTIVVVGSAVALIYGLQYLIKAFGSPFGEELQEFFVSVLAVEFFMLIFFWECKVYDLSSALFTAYLLALLKRGKFTLYNAVFALACVNRETAFLLLIVFAVYGIRNLPISIWLRELGFQSAVFIFVRLFLIVHYANSSGSLAWVRPLQNLSMYVDSAWQSLVYLAGTALVLWLCFRRWQWKPDLLRMTFLIMAPCLTILYTIFGYTFEIRAYAEIFPVIWVLAIWNLAPVPEWELSKQKLAAEQVKASG
jgi:hypothetical protein